MWGRVARRVAPWLTQLNTKSLAEVATETPTRVYLGSYRLEICEPGVHLFEQLALHASILSQVDATASFGDYAVQIRKAKQRFWSCR